MANRTVTAELEMRGKDATGPAFKSIAARMGQMEKQFSRFNRTAEQFNSKFKNIERTTSAMTRLRAGVDATSEGAFAAISRFAGPAAIAFGAKQAIGLAGDFEESLSKIQKKSGATAEQMANIKEQIFELGRQIPVSHTEIAAGFERGAAAGIPVDKLKEFATLSVKVADAWDTSAENVANTFAGFNVGLGIPIDKLEAYASLINDLADAGIADETGIADFIDRVGASLKNFGMTPEQIAAYGATLLDLKMPADVAARAMDTFTGKLFAPENLSKKSYSALSSVVGDMKAFSKMSGDQKVKFFFEQLSKLSNQQRASKLGALLGEGFDDEITRLVAGLDHLNERLKMAEDRASNPSNSVETGFQKKLQLWNSQTEILLNKWKEIAETIGEIGIDNGESILPYINDITDYISNAAKDRLWTERGLAKEGWGWQRFADEMVNTEDRRTQLQYEAGRSDPEFMTRWWEMKYRQSNQRGYASGGYAPENHSGPQQYRVAKTPYGRIPVPTFPAPPKSAQRQLSLEDEYGRYASSRSASNAAFGNMSPESAAMLHWQQQMDAADRGGVSPGAITDQSMKPMSWREFFFGDGKSLGEALKMDMTDSGFMQQAGQQAGESLGQTASEKLQGSAPSIGEQIGNAILSILSSWKPNINISGYSGNQGGNQGVNANVGKPATVTPPAGMSPRTPGGGGW